MSLQIIFHIKKVLGFLFHAPINIKIQGLTIPCIWFVQKHALSQHQVEILKPLSSSVM